MTKKEIIAQVESKFCNISEEGKNAWLERSKLIQLKKSDILVQEGTRSDKIWFISKGTVRAYYLKDGKKICDWFAFEKVFISAITSFLY